VNENAIVSIYKKHNPEGYDPDGDPLAYERMMQELEEYQELAEKILSETT
jgi:hypothetical protein